MGIKFVNFPAHRIFIGRYIDWEKVRERLICYKHIGAYYCIKDFQHCSDRSPYYCHYLAWRLGTWRDETLFEFFDNLLANGTLLENWSSNRNLLKSCNFDDFWGLVWQLQMAKFFLDTDGVEVKWMRSGPDLKVITKGGTFYVECYTYRKSFGIKEFIEELFYQVNRKIKVKHVSCTKFSLPKDRDDIERCLDEIFRPYLDQAFLESKIIEAQEEYPVLLPKPRGVNNLEIYVEGDDPTNYVPGRLKMGSGDSNLYLNHTIREALNNKRNSNQLKNHHPNLLAVNYLLDADFQMTFRHQKSQGKSIPLPNLGPEFDAVLLTACGIDECVSIDRAYLKVKEGHDHPLLNIFSEFKKHHT